MFFYALISGVFESESLHRSVASQNLLNVYVLSTILTFWPEMTALKMEDEKIALSPYYAPGICDKKKL